MEFLSEASIPQSKNHAKKIKEAQQLHNFSPLSAPGPPEADAESAGEFHRWPGTRASGVYTLNQHQSSGHP